MCYRQWVAGGGSVTDETESAGEEGAQLHAIRVFLCVAEEQSIARATRILYKAPSAVSRAVAELEKSIGVPLFDRGARGIQLNDYGKLVLVRARRIRDELAEAAADLAKLKPRKSSASPSAMEHLLFNNRKLRLLVHLVETRKISAAADRLGITQSGASMSLGRIEAALGASLFHRGLQGVIPTETAGRVAIRAKRVFAEIRHMEQDVTTVSGEFAGMVVIGTLPLGRTKVFPMAIADAISRHHGIRVTTIDSPFEQLIDGLRSGEVDAMLGVPRRETDLTGLAVEPLFTDRLIVVTRAGHPLTRSPIPGLAELARRQWILPWRSSPSRALFEAQFRRAGVTPPEASIESADLAVVRQLLAGSDALALVSARQMEVELETGALVALDAGFSEMERQVSLMLREGAMLSPVAMVLVDALRAQAALAQRG